jgi:hypothetical protein
MKHLKLQIEKTRKEPLHIIFLLRCQEYRTKKNIENCIREVPSYLQKKPVRIIRLLSRIPKIQENME